MMSRIPVQAEMGWGRARTKAAVEPRIRLRDILPPIAAVVVLTFAHVVYGAVQPIASLSLAAVFTVIAIASLLAAGPRHITLGMMAGAGVIVLYAVSGLAGPLHRSAAPLAVMFAAGALWVIAYIASRQRRALDIAWETLTWGSIAYCFWMFTMHVSLVPSGELFIVQAFETPANASVLFGLFAIIGMSKILHLIKQMDAEALARAHMVDRMLRQGLSSILLLGVSLTCLGLTGSQPGLIMVSAVLIGLLWWDTLAISTREHRGLPMRLASIVAPLVAIGLAGWGISLVWLNDETVSQGLGATDILPNAQRIEAYMGAWMNSPVFGHGLGSVNAEGDKAMTLFNAKAMLAPGEAHNVFITWLVETGIVGLSLLVLFIGAMYARIFGALKSRRTPRTFLRLAVAAGVFLLLHGMTDSSLDLPSAVWLYALLLGAACGVATGRRLQPQADEE